VEYEAKPDRRLWALLILGAAIVPSMVAVELAVPSFQPRIGGGGSPPPPATGGGGATAAVQVVMPNGVGVRSSLNFLPSTITVVIGVNNTISWTNRDSADHTVTFTTVPSGVQRTSITNPDVGPGETFTITLTVAGTYQYHCSFHPGWMRGTVIVKG
jgi:plastocyanin